MDCAGLLRCFQQLDQHLESVAELSLVLVSVLSPDICTNIMQKIDCLWGLISAGRCLVLVKMTDVHVFIHYSTL